MSKRHGGSSCAKFWICLSFLVRAVINCVDNMETKNLVLAAGVDVMVMATVKKDNTGVIVNTKVAKGCVDLWPRIASNAGSTA
ncbi:unnamed protein product [Nyctereutes procyonoides]|uniref:(raccoon dog) hypothetical protein n=1 Tax=Nyctereutes procyonoides TaxID=34880 RepID=A0A811YPP3_NYCPR|nr:unnamed protein product [Nyctereutes procyonoides]